MNYSSYVTLQKIVRWYIIYTRESTSVVWFRRSKTFLVEVKRHRAISAWTAMHGPSVAADFYKSRRRGTSQTSPILCWSGRATRTLPSLLPLLPLSYSWSWDWERRSLQERMRRLEYLQEMTLPKHLSKPGTWTQGDWHVVVNTGHASFDSRLLILSKWREDSELVNCNNTDLVQLANKHCAWAMAGMFTALNWDHWSIIHANKLLGTWHMISNEA